VQPGSPETRTWLAKLGNLGEEQGGLFYSKAICHGDFLSCCLQSQQASSAQRLHLLMRQEDIRTRNMLCLELQGKNTDVLICLGSIVCKPTPAWVVLLSSMWGGPESSGQAGLAQEFHPHLGGMSLTGVDLISASPSSQKSKNRQNNLLSGIKK
jgi:hypothetical protein